MGFKNVRAFAAATADEGKFAMTSYRKVPSQANTAGFWADLSMAAGNPVPNFYASEPLVAATLSARRGIYHGEDVAGDKYLTRLSAMVSATGSLHMTMLDYLLYYPFIDMDDGAEQALDNTVTLPRYETGEGVRAMMVAVAPYTGAGVFTVNYTNSQGVPGRSTGAIRSNSAATVATLLTGGTGVTDSHGPFLPLQSGDTGVRSVESVTFSVPNGGLAALVLVKPIFGINKEGQSAARETEHVSGRPGAPVIKNGAYLNFIFNASAVLTGLPICGLAEFAWS